MCFTEKDRQVLINGLKKYNNRGVLVTVDGMVCQDSDLDNMCLTSDAPYFYKASAIEDCSTGQLTEICFTKCTHNKA